MDIRGRDATTTITNLVVWWAVALVAVWINTTGALAAALAVSILSVLSGKPCQTPLLFITAASIIEIVLSGAKWYPLLGAMILYSSDILRMELFSLPPSAS